LPLGENMVKVRNLIEWTDKLSIGIEEIDEQHKVLVNLLNRLHAAIIQRNDTEVLEEILDELAQYTVIHFSVEESLMRIFNYPDYEEHKQHHKELTLQVVELKEKIRKEKLSISIEVLMFLRHWLTHHILVDDKKYEPFFVQHGLQKTWSERSWAGKIWDNLLK